MDKKHKKAIKIMMKEIMKTKTDEERNGFNQLYKMYKSKGYSDELFYKDVFTHMGFVKTKENK